MCVLTMTLVMMKIVNFVVKFLTVLSRFYLKEDGYSTGEHGDEVDEQKSS